MSRFSQLGVGGGLLYVLLGAQDNPSAKAANHGLRIDEGTC